LHILQHAFELVLMLKASPVSARLARGTGRRLLYLERNAQVLSASKLATGVGTLCRASCVCSHWHRGAGKGCLCLEAAGQGGSFLSAVCLVQLTPLCSMAAGTLSDTKHLPPQRSAKLPISLITPFWRIVVPLLRFLLDHQQCDAANMLCLW